MTLRTGSQIDKMMFTSCPSCIRQFRVRARQLAAAEGLVQCGYCGKQFNALERLYDKPLIPDSPLAPEPATPVLEAEAEFVIPEPESAAGDDLKAADQVAASETEVPPLEHERTETLAVEQVDGSSPYQRPAMETAREPLREPPSDETESAAVDDPSRISLDLEESHGSQTAPGREKPEVSASEEKAWKTADDYPFPEGLEAEQPQASGWLSRLAWTAALLLLVMVGASQAAWFNRDLLLSHYPQLLPYTKRICEQFGCTLIRHRNLSAIKLLNRDVRVHPRYESALLVNATISNLSKITQRFPVVLLTLYDPDGDVLGYRKIAPPDYLDSSIDIEAGMPSNSPIHFVFELAVDDQDAVSFEFDFL